MLRNLQWHTHVYTREEVERERGKEREGGREGRVVEWLSLCVCVCEDGSGDKVCSHYHR